MQITELPWLQGYKQAIAPTENYRGKMRVYINLPRDKILAPPLVPRKKVGLMLLTHKLNNVS